MGHIYVIEVHSRRLREELVGSTVFSWCFNRGAKSFYPCKRRRPDRLPLGLLGLLG